MVPTSRSKPCRTTSPSSRTYYGIDGCKGGWILARYRERRFTFSFHPTVSDIFEELRPKTPTKSSRPSSEIRITALIDIPIGLPESGERACDREGRKLLGVRSSTLFPVPVRAAVYAHSFAACGEMNLKGQGKKVSIQFWNIAPKVIEVDQFLQRTPSMIGRLCEGHPELAFRRLSGSVLPESKHTEEGSVARLKVLEQFSEEGSEEGLRGEIASFVQQHKKFCQVEDLLDAGSLALLLTIQEASPMFIGDEGLDACRLPMKIAT